MRVRLTFLQISSTKKILFNLIDYFQFCSKSSRWIEAYFISWFLRYVYVVVEKRLILPVIRAAIKCTTPIVMHYVLEIACIHDCCGKKKNHVSRKSCYARLTWNIILENRQKHHVRVDKGQVSYWLSVSWMDGPSKWKPIISLM